MIHYFCPFCWAAVSEDETTCLRCNRNLQDWGEKSYVEKLMQSLNHFDRSTVYRVCFILGERREALAVKPLVDLLNKTNDHFLMEKIVEALGKIGDERAVPYLINMLNNTSFLVRGKAATVLGYFDSRDDMTQALKRATGDISIYVRESARTSLCKLREGGDRA